MNNCYWRYCPACGGRAGEISEIDSDDKTIKLEVEIFKKKRKLKC